jgi:competence protein ComEC
VVPVGFVAIFTGWRFVAVIGSWLLVASERVVAWHVHWEPDWRIPDPPLWLSFALATAVVLLALVAGRRIAALCALGASVALLALLVWHPFPPVVRPGTFEFTAIDVGQGESLFLAFPKGQLVLLDGGGLPAAGRRRKPRLDIGEDVVSPYLWSRSIRRLDAVVLSHPHEDHIGGLAAVVENFRPKELWTGPVADTPEWRHLREVALRRGVHFVSLECGQHLNYGGTAIEVLAPEPAHVTSAKAPNNDSLVLRVSYGRNSFLFTGDIEKRVEWDLADAGLAHADVLKVPHHGSRTSSTEALLSQVRPAFAVISAGFENQFNNPHPDVVKRLEGLHAEVLRTDVCGLISLRSDGRRIRFETPFSPDERASPGLYGPF